ncbi:MAG TPA: FUSC family protein [Gaiellaceae bacterium]|nr:FUSC family protein [Gaiellaceae bacterium]
MPSFAGLASARLARVRRGLWPSAQTAAAAAISWWIARAVLSESRPLFAPIVAVIALGFTTGQRGRTAVQTVLGVAIGIAVADVVAHAIGAGGLQIAAVVFVAMLAGLLVGTSSTFVVQAAVSAVIVAAAYRPGVGLSPSRLLEALVGGAVALVFSQVLFPVDPVARAERAAARLVESLAEALERAARGEPAGAGPLPAAMRELDEALEVATQAVRLAPTRRRVRGTVDAYRDARPHLELAAASAATLARIAERAGDESGAFAPAIDAVAQLARRTDAERLAAARARIAELPDEPLTSAAARLTLESIAAELAAAARLETP